MDGRDSCRLYEVLRQAHEVFMAQTGDVVYSIVSRTVSEARSSEARGVAVFTFLINWNRVWYERSPQGRIAFGNLGKHLQDLVNAIERVTPPLRMLKDDLMDLDPEDSRVKWLITLCFDALSRVCGSTGASKVLHLLRPRLFAMWDERIREAFGVSADANGYVEFLGRIKGLAERVVREYAEDLGLPLDKAYKKLEKELGVTILKAIDEYNYLRFTRGMRFPSLASQHAMPEEELRITGEKLQKIMKLIEEIVNGAMEVAEAPWAVRTGASNLIRASARKLWRVAKQYADRNDLQGLLRYLNNVLRDSTGRRVAKYIKAGGRKTLEDVYPQILKIMKDC